MAAEQPHTRRWRAMGSDADLQVLGPEALLDAGQRRIEELEARWSRFREDSEVSRLTRHSGQPVVVSEDTTLLVRRAVEAWRISGGLVDPLVLGALVAAGYDRSFEALQDRAEVAARSMVWASALDIAVSTDGGRGIVCLPAGTGFDPGGLGKGLAADLVAAELLHAGAEGVCVNLGGDLRVAGVGPDDGGWTIALDHPFPSCADPERRSARCSCCADPERRSARCGPEVLALFGIAGGAVATSSTLRRTWRVGDDRRHHLIDPSTGAPARTDLVQATVIAGDAWLAEVHAKAVLLRGASRAFDLLPPAVPAVAVRADGVVLLTAGIAQFTGGVALPDRVELGAA